MNFNKLLSVCALFVSCFLAIPCAVFAAPEISTSNAVTPSGEVSGNILKLPAMVQPQRKIAPEQPSPVAEPSDLGGEKVKATICVQGGKPLELSPNVWGLFPRVLMPAEGTVQIKVTYPDGEPGEVMVLQAEDGGTINKGKIVTTGKLDDKGTISFRFKTTENLGVYHVTVRKGMDEKVFDFWAGPEPALQVPLDAKSPVPSAPMHSEG